VARPKKRNATSSPQLSGGQASYVLERLIAERRISQGDVNRHIGDMHREISSLESRLQMLRTHAGASAASTTSGATTGARRGRPPGSGTRKRRGRPVGSGRKAVAAPAAASATATAPAAATPAKRRRRSRITAEQLASRQLQGRYLGLIRQIPANKRAQYQRTAKEKGREAAINEMKATLKK
jgi:hypothetical protein